jgi:hypothetical protein
MRTNYRTCRRFTIAACIVAASLCPGAVLAEETVPHLENCTAWAYSDGRFGTADTCKEPVAIQFMLMTDQRIQQREVKPAEVFDTGLSRKEIESSGWLFTTCPAGYSPSVPFLLKNQDVILPSKYDCVRK